MTLLPLPGQPFDASRAQQHREAVDQRAIASAVVMLLRAIGEDPAREGLQETPERVARAWVEFSAGLRHDPREFLQRSFLPPTAARDLVLQRSIPFYSLCEHHLVPFYGHAAVAYIPNEESGAIVGLSKLVRVVRGYAARLQIQERLTAQVADAVHEVLGAQGTAVVVSAEHLCIGMRGIKAPGSLTTTSAMRGAFATDSRARAEVLQLLLPSGPG